MRPGRTLVLPLILGWISPLRAQTPVQEYQPAPRYSTFAAAFQLTGDLDRARELMLSWGRMATLGPMGAWMPSVELGVGISPGVRQFMEGAAVGPRVTIARAFPAQYVGLGRRGRGDPYLSLGAGMYASGDFEDRTVWGGAPALSAGLGLRIFSDKWDVDLSTVEMTVERRFGIQNGPARLYVRFGRALTPRRQGRRGELTG